MTQESPDRLEQRIRQALDERAEGLDAATLSRLRQARQQALDQGRRSPWWRRPWDWTGGGETGMPGVTRWAGALAGITLLALGLAIWQQRSDQAWPEAGDDLEVLASSDDLMLYQQLDFYLWLEQEREAQDNGSGSST